MDIFSLAVGFLTGGITGAAGNYLADRFTDARRLKQLAREETRVWQDIERRFPAIIAEMRADFCGKDGKGIRAFFLKESNTMMGFTSEPFFEYHTDKLANARAAVLHLAQHGFITDITHAGCPMFRVHEKLVDRLTMS